MFTCMCIYVCIYIYIYVYLSIYLFMYLLMCIYIYIYTIFFGGSKEAACQPGRRPSKAVELRIKNLRKPPRTSWQDPSTVGTP